MLSRYKLLASLCIAGFSAVAISAPRLPDTILFGAAYYSEYTPVDRVEEDARMMQAAGINVVRIAESTWGTLERAPGVFDFTHIDRVLATMQRYGIKVIVGTPAYAVPTWLAKSHPNVLVTTSQGPAKYGRRQNMDITDQDYRAAAERVIVALVDHVRDHPSVIGYQVDNETKHYDNHGAGAQAAFVASMQKRFSDLDALNAAFGFNYWSNRINRWEDFPSVTGSINASLSNAYAEFQRGLVTEFLAWQTDLVRAHARPDQFITHNFDMSWRGYSHGVQPDVNHWEAAKALDVAGIDVYHPSQEKLTGAEIAFAGDLSRSMRGGQNYLVIETQAQGMPEWTPFPGQLRLQAFSHLASGANMVAYWHWATTANAIETNWRGLLSQDYQPSAVYEEAKIIGRDLQRVGSRLLNLKKANKVAVYVSNTALSAFNSFKISADGQGIEYNDVVRGFYDALYRMNVEVDLLSPSSKAPLSAYRLIIVPSLYAASDAEIEKLNAYAKAGGHLLYGFKSGFSDENTKVRYDVQPGRISAAAGVRYHQFTIPNNVSLDGDPFAVGQHNNSVRWWMEFLEPTTATVVARYKHPAWSRYAAMTRNSYGKGEVAYLGFMPTANMMEKILLGEVTRAGVADVPALKFPIIVRSGNSSKGRQLRYLLNYSEDPQQLPYPFESGTDLLSGTRVMKQAKFELPPWGVAVIEQQ